MRPDRRSDGRTDRRTDRRTDMIGVKGKHLCAGNPNAAGQTDGRTDGRTDGHGDSSIPPP